MQAFPRVENLLLKLARVVPSLDISRTKQAPASDAKAVTQMPSHRILPVTEGAYKTLLDLVSVNPATLEQDFVAGYACRGAHTTLYVRSITCQCPPARAVVDSTEMATLANIAADAPLLLPHQVRPALTAALPMSSANAAKERTGMGHLAIDAKTPAGHCPPHQERYVRKGA